MARRVNRSEALNLLTDDQVWRMMVGSRIRGRRGDLDLNQDDLRDRLEKQGVSVTRASVSNLEHGQGLTIEKLLPLSQACECSITYLLGLTDDPNAWEPEASRV